jgi:hypothetical protein
VARGLVLGAASPLQPLDPRKLQPSTAHLEVPIEEAALGVGDCKIAGSLIWVCARRRHAASGAGAGWPAGQLQRAVLQLARDMR